MKIMKYNYLELAEIIKEKRKEKGISTRDLGEKVGVSHTEISRIENGMRPHFSFVVLAKICKELDIDMMNLLDDTGVWKVDFDKLFYVMFKQDEEKIFKVHARSEYEAMRIAFDFVETNELIDFKKSDKDLLIGIVQNPEDFNETIIKNFEKTGQLNAEEIDDNEEDFDSESEEEFEENCCENCIFFCPNCCECTLED
jgi:transcriptional regulator with XRE-family HTH domain